MEANCQSSAVGTLVQGDREQNRVAMLIYKSATILAILLFLISFWSC